MKKLFTAIRTSDLETVKQIIEKKPELVNCTVKQPLKKDDGQSPLQVALKTGNTAIANYLLDHGANVNFIEDESCCNHLKKVLQALKDAGADPSYKAPNLGYSVREFCNEGSISILFDEVFG